MALQSNAKHSLLQFGFGSPYPCVNHAAQCERLPEVNKVNQFFGCVQIDTDGGCTLQKCPAFLCGNQCPKPCSPESTTSECVAALTADPSQSDCSTFYTGMVLRMIRQTPLSGCTGACVGDADGTTGCCADATIELLRLPDGPPLRLNGSTYATADPQLTIENFLNGYLNCLAQSCICPQPVTSAKAGVATVPCAGHGTCQLFREGGSKLTGFCVCSDGFGGLACETQTRRSGDGCLSSWSSRNMRLEECGGADRGSCDPRTNKCICNDGFAGDACSERACASTNETLCSGNGRCNLIGMCICEPGFYGIACQCHRDSTGKEVCVKDAGAGSSNVPHQPPNTDNLANDVMGEAATAAAKQRKRNLIIAATLFGVVAIVIAVVILHHRHRPAQWARRARIVAVLQARVQALQRRVNGSG